MPQLFWHNAIVILSNGHESRIGTITSEWEHFAEWRRAISEDEPPAVSLETLVRGVADPVRLLDLVENFTIYSNSQGKPIKLLAKNHQFLGVQRAVAAMDQLGDRQGKLGVFWHTQGSGKSLSMLFFAQKVLRKQPGNWTFVIVTDRDLAPLYPAHLLAAKNDLIYQHIYDAYPSRADNLYTHLTY